jgi:bleomycin hydrolase
MKIKIVLLLKVFVLYVNTSICQYTINKKLACTQVQDQYLSGTCWSFASLSFLESEMLRLHNMEVNLSEMFVARHAYMYKIKEHLKQKGKNYFTSGGQFQDVQRVCNEYGIVPETAYTGKPKNTTQHNHGILDTIIVHYVNKLLTNKVTVLNIAQEKYINILFDKYLGKLPKTFVFNNKSYTPSTFFKKVVQLKMEDYINVTAYNKYELDKEIILDDKYNWSNSTYYNTSFNNFLKTTENAIQKGYTVLWDGDVTESSFDFENGTALLQVNSQNVENQRNETYNTLESKIDHVMHIVGAAKNSKNENCYYIKNSWGKSNKYEGFMYMNTLYFAIKTIAIVVHKDMLQLK